MSELFETTLNENKLKLIWNDLSFKTDDNKSIINELNGEIVSGQLTAILGPSGSGKTTLIECIANKRKTGLSGKVYLNQNNKKKTNIRIAYNSQNDGLINLLTVEESLLYASQLRNRKSKRYDFFNAQQIDTFHDENYNSNSKVLNTFPDENIERELIEKRYKNQIQVRSIIEVFNLEHCADVRAVNCSGGQRKRLSIALELIFSPNILLLDEPTSGLDSVSCLQCVSLLKTLSNNKEPIIIAASIHQPSAKILSYFDRIYVLSIDGKCIYNGLTDELINHLSTFDLMCPLYHNPADFVLEIASGDHGKDAIEKLIDFESSRFTSELNVSEKGMISVTENPVNYTFRDQLIHVWILLRRCTLISFRDPIIYWLRLLGCVMSLGTKYMVYHNTNIGEREGCLNSTSLTKALKSMATDSENLEINLSNRINIGYLLTLVLFTHAVTVAPTLMSFPIELSSFIKENFNKWYTHWSYFIAKSLTDIPSVIIFPLIYATILYIITDQINEMWRFNVHLLIIFIFALLSHSYGLLISAFFVERMSSSLIAFGIMFFPFVLFSGFMIPINKMPKILQPFSYISIFRLAFESLILVIYGFDRCKQTISSVTFNHLKAEFGVDLHPIDECLTEINTFPNITTGLEKFNNYLSESSSSKVLEFFLIKEENLYSNVILMIIYAIVLRVLAYYVLKWRTKVK